MTSALDADLDGAAGDWRMAFVARVAGDAPPYKDGEIIRQVSAVEAAPGVTLSFATPSSVALALSIAQRAALHAAEVRLAIPHAEVRAAGTTAFAVKTDAIPLLYDFFEQSMIGAVFSYLAIEAFANQVIARELTQSLEVDYRGRRQTLTPEQLERRLATREKLSQVLPVVRSVPSPKGTALWERFTKLELARDSTVHLKVKDQYPQVKESLYFQMLTADAGALPGTAAEMIRHYYRSNAEPRWLMRFLQSRDEVAQAARSKSASQSGGAPQP